MATKKKPKPPAREYLVAVRASDGNEVFTFTERAAALAFVADCATRGVETLTSTAVHGRPK